MRFHKLEEHLVAGKTRYLESVPAGLLQQFKAAQKFYFGSVTQFPGNDIYWGAYPRLPYPLALFEIEVVSDGILPFIILAHENENTLAFHIFNYSPLSCLSAFWGVFLINRSAPPESNGAWLHWSDRVSGFKELLKNQSAAAVAAVGLALQVLNCTNVSTEIVPPSKKLNKKREANNKPPIYSYRVLVLRPSAAQRMDKGGSHDSPRVHLRRGHIKRRKTGNYWWQPCVVGNKQRGMVLKDYRADQLVTTTQPNY